MNLDTELRPRLYLAGKVLKNDWRHSVIPNLRTHIWRGRNVIPMQHFDYVGPFVYSCDHGCAHGTNKHGVLGSCNSDYLAISRSEVFNRCMMGVRRCDLFVAYITSIDAYGTFLEIGYAFSLGRSIVLCFAPNIDSSHFWFYKQAASKTYCDVRAHCLTEIVRRELTAVRGGV